MLYINYPKYTPIVLEYLGFNPRYFGVIQERNGSFTLRWDTNVISVPSESMVTNNTLAALKDYRLKEIREEASKRILAKWPMWMQMNCATGIYPDSVLTSYKNDVAAVITASNTAEDAVINAATIEDVETVTVTWPIL